MATLQGFPEKTQVTCWPTIERLNLHTLLGGSYEAPTVYLDSSLLCKLICITAQTLGRT